MAIPEGHTPLPWGFFAVHQVPGGFEADLWANGSYIGGTTRMADARLIVESVNGYDAAIRERDDLRRAARHLVDWHTLDINDYDAKYGDRHYQTRDLLIEALARKALSRFPEAEGGA